MRIRNVLAIVLFNMTAFRASRVVMALYALELGASQFAVGAMAAMYSLLPALIALQVGKVIDRLGVRLPMLIGSTGIAIGLLLPGLFRSLPALYVSAALLGVSHMMANVSSQSLVGALGKDEDRTRNFANYSLIMAACTFVGPMLGGASIDYLGHVTSYFCLAVLPLVPVVLVAFGGHVGRSARVKSEEEKAVLSSSLLSNPDLRRVLISSSMAITGTDLFSFYMPIYGHSVGLSGVAIGLVLGMFGVAAFFVRMWLPALTRRWGPEQIFNTSLYIAAAAFALFPLFSGVPALAALSLVLGLGLGCAQPVTLTLIYSRAPKDRSGEALGLRITINQCTHIAVPLIFGSLGTIFGLAPVFLANAGILVGGAWLNRVRKK